MPVTADPSDLSTETIFHSPPRFSEHGTPTWEMAYLFPSQGARTENEHLALDTNWLLEFNDGCVEVLPMPTVSHVVHGEYRPGQVAESVILPGFTIDVARLFGVNE